MTGIRKAMNSRLLRAGAVLLQPLAERKFGDTCCRQFQRRESPMPFAFNPAAVWPIVMLFASNIFMTFAWYGHLKHKGAALVIAIVVSWAIAFFEYCLAVPANRIGSAIYSTAQLKTMQEVITLLVFSGFSVFWLGESLTWNHVIGFALIAIGASFIFRG